MDVPDVRYLRTERGAIAHQHFGEGDRTIIWSGPPIVSIETRWSRATNIRLWEFLASLGQVVMFDYRGFGVSEHVPLDRVGELDELRFDLAAVVSAFATGPVTVIATGTASPVAISLAANQPTALERLILLNATARPVFDETTAGDAVAEIRGLWGTGELLTRGPTVSSDAEARRAAARTERLSATPAVAEQFTRAQLLHDVRPLLPAVTIPTLIIHTGDAARITPGMTQEVAAGIPGAIYVVRPSALFNWGEWDLDIKRFITGCNEEAAGWRDLAAIMFSDIVGSTDRAARMGDTQWRETLALFDLLVEAEVTAAQGRVVKQTGDGHLMEFARPSDALRCARRLIGRCPEVGLEVRIGLHFGEIERRPGGDIGGIAVHLASRIASEAHADEVLVSRTVAELTIGDGRTYTSHGHKPLKGIPGQWEILSLDDGPAAYPSVVDPSPA